MSERTFFKEQGQCDVPAALIGMLVALSLGARKKGSADSTAFVIVISAKTFITDAMVPPLIPPK
jgi:hypothetical protein